MTSVQRWLAYDVSVYLRTYVTRPRNKSMAAINSKTKSSSVLKDFESSLSAKVSSPEIVNSVLSQIYTWTHGQPFLTKLLCQYVLLDAGSIISGEEDDFVDTLIETKVLKNWRKQSASQHLKALEKKLVRYSPRDSLLILYLQVLQRGMFAPTNASPEQTFLQMAGLITIRKGKLKVSNSIYARVFNEAWIERQLPGITRPVSIVKTSVKKSSVSPQPFRRTSDALKQRWLRRKPLSLICGLIVGSVLVFSAFNRTTQRNLALERSSEQAIAVSAAEAALTGIPSTGIPSTGIPSKVQAQLTLLGDTFSGYSTFRNEDFQAVLEETGISLVYADEFDQTLRAQQLNQGDADLMVTTLDQFLKQQPQGKIVGLLDRTIGADAVVLNTKKYPQLKSLLDLRSLLQTSQAKGEKLSIAYASDTPSEYLALVLDTQFDTFNLSDFELKPVADASEAWQLMQNPIEKVAIAVLWEPYVEQARQAGYNVVLSSQDAPSAIVDVLVASDTLIETKPEVVASLLEKYYRRIDSNARDATQLQTQVAEDADLSVGDAAAIINGIDFFSAAEAKSWFDDGTLKTRIEATAAVLALSNKLDTVPRDPSSLYAGNFVTEAADNTQALINLIRADNPALADKLAGKSPVVTASTSVSDAQIQAAPDIGNFQLRGQVSFDSGSAALTPEGKQTLSQLASELKEFNRETVALRVIGHTSKTGSAAANLALSQQRATVVTDQLKRDGIELNAVAEGKGFSEPLSAIAPDDSRQQRTEIRLVRVN